MSEVFGGSRSKAERKYVALCTPSAYPYEVDDLRCERASAVCEQGEVHSGLSGSYEPNCAQRPSQFHSTETKLALPTQH